MSDEIDEAVERIEATTRVRFMPETRGEIIASLRAAEQRGAAAAEKQRDAARRNGAKVLGERDAAEARLAAVREAVATGQLWRVIAALEQPQATQRERLGEHGRMIALPDEGQKQPSSAADTSAASTEPDRGGGSAAERERAGSWQDADVDEQAYEVLVGMLKARFPANPDGSLPDFKIEEVLRENARLRDAAQRARVLLADCLDERLRPDIWAAEVRDFLRELVEEK